MSNLIENPRPYRYNHLRFDGLDLDAVAGSVSTIFPSKSKLDYRDMHIFS